MKSEEKWPNVLENICFKKKHRSLFVHPFDKGSDHFYCWSWIISLAKCSVNFPGEKLMTFFFFFFNK